MELYMSQEQAERRATEIGCVGSHTHDINGVTYYMPCNTHDTYQDAIGVSNPTPKQKVNGKDKTIKE